MFSSNKKIFLPGWFLIVIPWFFLRWSILKSPIGNADYNVLKSLLLNLPAVIPYIGKTTLPFNLSVLPLLQDMTFCYGAITIIFLSIFLCLAKNKRPNYIIFGILWFVMFLVPSFVQSMSSVPNFSEHRAYFSLIGFLIVILEIDYIKNLALKKKNDLVLGIIVLVFFSIITIIHSRNFKDRLSFWKNATITSPNSAFNHNNLGAMYFLDRIFDKAESEWKKAVRLNSDEKLAHNNLGIIYMNKGLFDKAESEYKKEIEINPFYGDVYLNLGLLYYRQSKLKEAERVWKKALQINPNNLEIHSKLDSLKKITSK